MIHRCNALGALCATMLCLVVSACPARGQVGALLWSDEFDDLGNWIALTGNGGWGWGNGELQYYQSSNVDIAPVPGEPGNSAMRITARQESGPGITDQWGNPLQYTSGRVMSKSMVSVQYGMIEARVRVPSLAVGGWPAFWLLGTTNYAWPRSGEMDLMELGSTQAFRDLHDTHNGGNGLNNSTEDQVVSANAIFYSDAAVNPGNPSGAASLSYDPTDIYCRPFYDHVTGLDDRFLLYRLYWDDSSLRFTVVDGGIEHDLYTTPFTIDAESAEFQQPFYMIANLALGGAFTDAYNLGDPGSGVPMSMPLPAEMYVDYVRVYEWNGKGQVHLGPPNAEAGRFGIFTETTPTSGNLVPQVSSEVYVWEGTLVDGTIPPFEGTAALSWQTNGKGWFGGGVMSIQPLNLFDFGGGTLDFRIKIPANVTFKIGIIDAWGNQSYVSFPAFQSTYGLVRDGQWGQASIPVADIRGAAIDLRMMSYSFVILEEQGTACDFSIDDITWDSGVATAVGDVATPTRIRLLPNRPNPFNPATSIQFELSNGGPYELKVFDSAGRLVRNFEGVGTAGMNRWVWDGRDGEGHSVASGVFHYRVDSLGASATGNMTLVK